MYPKFPNGGSRGSWKQTNVTRERSRFHRRSQFDPPNISSLSLSLTPFKTRDREAWNEICPVRRRGASVMVIFVMRRVISPPLSLSLCTRIVLWIAIVCGRGKMLTPRRHENGIHETCIWHAWPMFTCIVREPHAGSLWCPCYAILITLRSFMNYFCTAI